jgi:hypothetical protein
VLPEFFSGGREGGSRIFAYGPNLSHIRLFLLISSKILLIFIIIWHSSFFYILITFLKSLGQMPNLIAPAGAHVGNAAGIDIFNEHNL